MSSFSNAFKNKQIFKGALGAHAARAYAWYKAEFCSLFSPETVAWLFDRGDRKLVIRAGDSAKALRFADADQRAPGSIISASELLASSVDAALARRGVAREAAKIYLEIPRDAFFVRRFDIPAAAEANLPQLLLADIERKTPFRQSDVVYGHTLSRRADAPGKYAVQLWILRRDIVAAALEGSGVAWNDLDQVAPERLAGEETPMISLDRGAADPHWFRTAAIALAATAFLLFALGVVTLTLRQDQAEKEIDEKIAEFSQRAARVRKVADEAVLQSRLLQTLREERGRGPRFADLWEEVSRVLPDGAYLTEFRLSEGKTNESDIDLVGFADSAVGLPALFDKSPMFSEAGLTAPITPNAQEKREAFSLRVKVKQKRIEEAK